MLIPTSLYNEFKHYIQTLKSDGVISHIDYFKILGLNVENTEMTEENIEDYEDHLTLKGERAGTTSIPDTEWFADWQKQSFDSSPLDNTAIVLSSRQYARFVAWLDKEIDSNVITASIKHGALGIDVGTVEENEKEVENIFYTPVSKQIPDTHIYQHYLTTL